MSFRTFTLLAAAALLGTPLATGCASTHATQERQDLRASPAEVVHIEDVAWEDLNPARGDQSPRAGTLWGDRKANVATGYLLRPVDGFRSPPHIHNVSYRAVVLDGVLHNADAAAPDMWMPAGSFWTQPKGQPHITAAKGKTTLAYIEIDEGPYLVHPVSDAFATPERPLNIHAQNVVWVPQTEHPGVAFAYLWGSPNTTAPHGLFVRLSPGKRATIQHHGEQLRVLSVAGKATLARENTDAHLHPGTLFSSHGKGVHPLTCADAVPCVFYVRATAPLELARH